MIFIILFLLVGIAAIVCSAMAWRLKDNNLFIAGVICTAIILIFGVWQSEWLYTMLMDRSMFGIVLYLSFLGLPIYFLVMAKKANSSGNSLDESAAGGAVTEDYLDEIINAPDEDIDFEDDMNLK